MPVATGLGIPDRHRHDVSLPGDDLVVAAGAAVALDRFVRLDVADLDGVVVAQEHGAASRSAGEDRPGDEDEGARDRDADEHDVGAALHTLAIRVVPHDSTVEDGVMRARSDRAAA